MKSLPTLFALGAFLLSPALLAQDTLIAPTAIASSTSGTDFFPVGNLINGSGLSGTPTPAALGTHQPIDSTTAWVTTGSYPNDYFASLPPPVLTCTLPSLQWVSGMVIWGYGGNFNEAKSFTVSFSTDGVNFGNPATVSTTSLLGTGGAQLAFSGGTRLATHVKVTVTDNYHTPSTIGDRVGLGELRFVGQIAPLVVTNANDSGPGSLREMLGIAAFQAGADTITFSPSLNGATITMLQANGSINIADPAGVTVDTVGLSSGVSISGDNKNFRMFTVAAGGNLTLRGLKLLNGGGTDYGTSSGAAIFNLGTVTLSQCLFKNHGAKSGGAIDNGGTMTISGCNFEQNLAYDIVSVDGGEGGAILNYQGTMTLAQCNFTGNSVNGNGAAIATANGAVTLTQSAFSGNDAVNGGAIYNENSNLILENCTISNNVAYAGGGILSNTDAGFTTSSTVLNQCTIAGNTANTNGGGIFNFNGRTTLTRCTVSGNSAPTGFGSGILSAGDPETRTEIGNSIVAGNGVKEENLAVARVGGYTGTLFNTFISNGYNLIDANNITAGAFNGAGDILNRPALLAALGNYGGFTRTMPPMAGSPAIDAASATPAVGNDQRGASRTTNCGAAPDIGAVELGQITVTTAADENNGYNTNGISLREALSATTPFEAELIRFASNLNGATISIKNPQGTSAIIASKPVSGVDAKDLPAGLTIRNENVANYRLFFVPPDKAVSFHAVSFVNTGGAVWSAYGEAFALNAGASLGISQCTFSGYRALRGGAILNEGYTVIVQSTFSDNRTTESGGAIHNQGSMMVFQSSFIGNQATGTGGGGAISNNGKLTMENCTLASNSALYAGAIENETDTNLSLPFPATCTLRQCTLSLNQSTGTRTFDGGGAIDNYNNATLALTGCIVAGNTSATSNGPDLWMETGSLNATGCLIGNGTSSTLTHGVANNLVGSNASPIAANLFPPGFYGGPTQTMLPQPGSPVIDPAGGAVSTAPFDTDQRGRTRMLDGDAVAGATIDIGAVEFDRLMVASLADSGPGSLRDTFTAAPAGSTLTFAPLLSGGSIPLTSEIVLNKNITLDASALPGGITLDGVAASVTNRIFMVHSGQTVVLKNLTLTGGGGGGTLSNNNGGAVYNNGTLTLERCTLTGNNAPGSGGAIFNDSTRTLTLTDCTLNANTTSTSGGGAILNLGTLTANKSTLSNNTAAGSGGAIQTGGGTTTTLTHCTLAGNSCAADGNSGSAIRNNGSLSLTHCTLAGNTMPLNFAAGIYNEPSRPITMAHCIAHGNSGSDILNNATLNVTGTSIIGVITGSGTSTGTILTSNPLLAPLGNNGGPTQTMALLAESPARNAAVGSTITTDQRGFPLLGIADIGACEGQLGSIADATTIEDHPPIAINIPVSETGNLTASSSVPGLVSGFDFGGSGSNATLVMTPAPDQNGIATVTVTHTPSGETRTFTLTVNAVNDSPSFVKGPNQTALEDSGPQIVNNWASGISAGPANENAQTASFIVTTNDFSYFSAAPAVAPDGTLTYTPAPNAYGSATIYIRLQDNGGTAAGGQDTSAQQTFTINLTPVNDAPSFIVGPDQTVAEDSGTRNTGGASGISEGAHNETSQTVSFIVTNDNSALFATQPTISSGGGLTFRPAANAHGSATVSVSLRDNGGTANGGDDTSAVQTFTITVTPVNDPPAFTKGNNQTVLEDAGPQIVNNWASGITAGPANENSQTVGFIVTTNDTSYFSAAPAVAPDGTLTYTPAPNAYGNAIIYVRLQDNGGTAAGGQDNSAQQSFTINLTPVNDAPSFIAGSDQTVTEDSGTHGVGWANGISDGPNESGQTSTFTVTNNNNALFSTQPAVSSSGGLTFRPAANAHGSATVSVSLRDDGGTANGGVDTSAVQTFTITVTPVNDPPAFTGGNNQTVLEDAGPRSVSNWASGISAGPANENSQTVSFLVTNDNAALFSAAPAIAPNGTLTFTPAPNAYGSAIVLVSLGDNGGTANGGTDTSAVQGFTITVTPVNDAPSFIAGPDQTVTEDAQTLAFSWTSGISDGPNEGGQTSNFTVTNDNNALFSTQPAVSSAGVLTFGPAANAVGSATVSVSLQDDGGTANGGVNTSAVQTFTITVTPVNDPPAFTKGADQAVLEDAGPQSVSNWATGITAGPSDENAQTVSFTVTHDNGALFAVAPAIAPDGTLTYTPAADANGTTTVSVSLQDNGGTANGGIDTSAVQTFTIHVISLEVTTTSDNGPGSLRQVIADAATVPGADPTITFAPSLNGATILLGGSEINLVTSLTIDASDLPAGLTLSGNSNGDATAGAGESRIFVVSSGITVALHGLTLQDGISGGGGAIWNSGNLSLTRCTLSNNMASFSGTGVGGAIRNGGMLSLTHCTLTGNQASGGISGYGGAIYNTNSGSSVELRHCTISGNTAMTGGGGVANGSPGTALSLTGSLIAANTSSSAPDVSKGAGTVTGSSVNIIGNNDTVTTEFPAGALVGTSASPLAPLLAPLGHFGGPTRTMPPLPGSPAIDPAAGATTSSFATDQRGPGFPRLVGARVDIGAVESGSAIPALMVDTTADENDGLGVGGISLRDAIAFAPAGSTIVFAPTLSGPITLNSGSEIVLTKSVNIDAGNRPGGMTIDGGTGSNRIFSVNTGQTVLLKALTLTGGGGTGAASNTNGGAAYNNGTLTLERCILSGNSASGSGGAIFNNIGKLLTLTECTLASNSTTTVNGGGAILNQGTLTGSRTTFSNNTAAGSGGAIQTGSSTTTTLTHCTLAGNSCGGGGNAGGAIRNNGALMLTYCTVSGNSLPTGFGGGIYNEPSRTITLSHCILYGNTGRDIFNNATLNVTDPSIIGVIGGSGTSTGTILTSNPLLAPMANYGGPTQTMALLPGSPARNAATGSTITADQRGFPIVGTPDIGAYEAGTFDSYTTYIWETLPTAGNGSLSDPLHATTYDYDGDGQNNQAEWLALTDAGSPSSWFRITQTAMSGNIINITFPTVIGRTYQLQSSPNLANPWSNIGSPTPGTGGNVTLPVDVTGWTKYFFRVSVAN